MNNRQKKCRKSENGFSYIDVMIAIVILMVGVVALAGTLTANLVRSFESEKRIIAKQIAVSTIESIISARDIARSNAIKGWDSVGNVGTNPNPDTGEPQGIFLKGWGPIHDDLGADGVAGTADDACPTDSICEVKGPPNNSPLAVGFERKIVITDLQDAERPSPPYAVAQRKIEIFIRYNTNQAIRQVVMTTIITNYE